MSIFKICQLATLLFLLITPRLGLSQWKLINKDCAFPASKTHFNVVGDDQPVTDGDLDKPEKKAAKMPQPLPHAAEVARSEQAYDAGEFTKAAAHLRPFASEELISPHVLNQYARSLYRAPGSKPQGYAAYKRLIALLDAYGRENATTCVVYLDFDEAYYKLATMQMDNAEWKLAAYNLSRFLYALNAVPSSRNDAIYQSALEYQTECFAAIGEVTLTRHYAQRTLKKFPKNQYVLPYLAQLPPERKPKR